MYILAIVFLMTSLRADFASDMLDAHNNYRLGLLNGTETRQPQAQTMPMMTWDPTLAAKAQEWTDNCVFEDSSDLFRRIPGYEYVGENIAAGTNYANVTEAVHAWYEEIVDYVYETNTCNKKCCHYTQVVWANSTKLGCGKTRCPNLFKGLTADFIVCMYSPGGNWVGEKPYVSVGPVISPANTIPTTPVPTTTTTTTTPAPTTTTTTKTTPVPVQTRIGPTTNTPPGVVIENSTNMVKIHNTYRQAILAGTETRLPKAKALPKISRDSVLAESAQRAAAKCQFMLKPEDLVDTRFTVSGNIYNSTASDEFIVADWYSQIVNYNYSLNKCTGTCISFLNIITASCTKLGCARNNCNGTEYVVCLYAIAPNTKFKPYIAA